MAEFRCDKLKSDGNVCGEVFPSSQALGAHTRWVHPTEPSGGGGAGDGDRRALDLTRKRDLEASLKATTDLPADRVSPLLEVLRGVRHEDPAQWPRVRGIMKSWGVTKPEQDRFMLHYYQAWLNDDDEDGELPFSTSPPRSRRTVELEGRLSALEEAQRARAEEERRAQDQKALDERFRRLESMIVASAQPAVSPSATDKTEELKKELEALRTQLQDQREAQLRRELDDVKARLLEQGKDNGPGKVTELVKGLKCAAHELGMIESPSPWPGVIERLGATAGQYLDLLKSGGSIKRPGNDPPQFTKITPEQLAEAQALAHGVAAEAEKKAHLEVQVKHLRELQEARRKAEGGFGPMHDPGSHERPVIPMAGAAPATDSPGALAAKEKLQEAPVASNAAGQDVKGPQSTHSDEEAKAGSGDQGKSGPKKKSKKEGA